MVETSVQFPSVGRASCQLRGLLGTFDDGAMHPAALLCHPGGHGQTGMEYPVIAACCVALEQIGFITLRFNFRGVQGSQGDRTGGLREADDVLGAISFLRGRRDVDRSQIYLVGDSFGAAMILEAARTDQQVAGIICVVLPLNLLPAPPDHLQDDHRPKLFIVAEQDQFCDLGSFMALYQGWAAPKDVTVLEGTDHFLGIGFSDDTEDCSVRISQAVASWLDLVCGATR